MQSLKLRPLSLTYIPMSRTSRNLKRSSQPRAFMIFLCREKLEFLLWSRLFSLHIWEGAKVRITSQYWITTKSEQNSSRISITSHISFDSAWFLFSIWFFVYFDNKMTYHHNIHRCAQRRMKRRCEEGETCSIWMVEKAGMWPFVLYINIDSSSNQQIWW